MKLRLGLLRGARRLPRMCVGILLLTTGCVEDRIPTGPSGLPGGAGLVSAASAGELRAYVVDPTSDLLSVIRVADHSVVTTIPLTERPQHVAVTPDGRFAYAAHFVIGAGPAVNLTVIRTVDNAIVATLPKVGLQTFNTTTITPDGAFAYLSNANYSSADPARHVQVLRTSDNTVVATIDAGPHTTGAVTPDGAFVYMTGNAGVTVIRTSDNTVVATIPTTATPNRIVLTPDGSRAYVSHSFSDVITVISTSDNTVLTTLSVASSLGLGISPDGSQLYVTNRYVDAPGTVTVIRTSDHGIAHVVAVGNEPQHVELTPDGSLAYVSNFASGTVSVIRTVDHAVIATVPVSAAPFFIAFALLPTSAQGIASLQDAVADLAAAGHLNAGLANALRRHLDNALRALERGQTTPAIAQLNAFIAQLHQLVADGVLTPDQAAPLIAAAEEVIAGIS